MVECKYLPPSQSGIGKPAWYGRYQLQAGGMWFNARSGYGVIRYETPEAAIAGARVCQTSDWEWHAAQKAAPE